MRYPADAYRCRRCRAVECEPLSDYCAACELDLGLVDRDELVAGVDEDQLDLFPDWRP